MCIICHVYAYILVVVVVVSEDALLSNAGGSPFWVQMDKIQHYSTHFSSSSNTLLPHSQ